MLRPLSRRRADCALDAHERTAASPHPGPLPLCKGRGSGRPQRVAPTSRILAFDPVSSLTIFSPSVNNVVCRTGMNGGPKFGGPVERATSEYDQGKDQHMVRPWYGTALALGVSGMITGCATAPKVRPAAHWAMSEPGGEKLPADSSGHGREAALHGDVRTGAGASQRAASFPGDRDSRATFEAPPSQHLLLLHG